MAKPHYKLTTLGQCPIGAKVFRVARGGRVRQLTKVGQAKNKVMALYGHRSKFRRTDRYDIAGHSYPFAGHTQVWMPV